MEARAELAVVRTAPAAGRRFPLAGTWTVAAGASLHSHHRWAVPEEFALDLVQVDARGRTFRTEGAANADFHAWGAPVRAIAGGRVVRVVDRFDDGPILRRQPGEAPEAYLGRVQQAQMALFAQGSTPSSATWWSSPTPAASTRTTPTCSAAACGSPPATR